MAALDGVEVLFFDLDNTVYDFVADMNRVLRHVHGQHPEPLGRVPCDDFVATYWRAVEAMDAARRRELITSDPHRYRATVFEAVLREVECGHDGLHEDLARLFADHRFSTMAPFPGARDTIRALRKRYTVGLITNGPPSIQRPKIKSLRVPELIPDALTIVSGEFGEHKPHPSIFEEAARRAGAPPEACCMIGDSLECDVGAKAHGWKAVWFNAVGMDPADVAGAEHAPDAVVSSYTELAKALAP